MNIHKTLITLLQSSDEFSGSGKVIREKVSAVARKGSEELMSLLLNDEKLKSFFFSEISGALIFDREKFENFLHQKDFLPNNYTAFRNKIGLKTKSGFLGESRDVVLSFPYKDCVLEGGQAREKEKREEVFWNETLAPDEIDRLFEPKVLTAWKRFTASGEQPVGKISDNENLLLKGNNLIALHTLLRKFRGSVKLICIDPPYNTGNDGFNYHDRFSHSTWLTFMKNRLEAARELLNEDGILYIHCDDRENAYLKVLCDEIFGRDKFITNLIWRKKAGGANDSKDIAVEHEYILAYRKNRNGIFKMPLDEKTRASYKFEDEKLSTHGPYKTKDLNDKSLSDSPGLHYDITFPDGTVLSGAEHQWKCNRETFEKRLSDNRIVFKKSAKGPRCHYKIYLNEERGELRYDEQGNIIPRGRNLSSVLYNTALNKDGNTDLKKLFGKKVFSYPKPVKLIRELLQSASGPGDLVMDFFAGSGTLGQAVMSLAAENPGLSSRRFILVEQMDYIRSLTAPRLVKSLEACKLPHSFLYAELLAHSAAFIPQIAAAESKEALLEIINKALSLDALHYSAAIHAEEFRTESFKALSLEEQKQLALSLLEKNRAYVGISSAGDEGFQISEEDISLSEKFLKE